MKKILIGVIACLLVGCGAPNDPSAPTGNSCEKQIQVNHNICPAVAHGEYVCAGTDKPEGEGSCEYEGFFSPGDAHTVWCCVF